MADNKMIAEYLKRGILGTDYENRAGVATVIYLILHIEQYV